MSASLTTPKAGSAASPSTVEKVFVAVHGIGDQISYGTIQSVVNRFCAFVGQPAGIPVGSFHTLNGPLSIGAPHDPKIFGPYAFTEAYWADFPRKLVDDKHKLEESRAWARTIVERLRLRYTVERERTRAEFHAAGRPYEEPPQPDFALVEQVLSELIFTIAVLDRLCFLADKAGVFKFDLRQLLDDYLGDVQCVVEFQAQRAEILAAFESTMSAVNKSHPNASIYIVAHSEGTVVAFLGLLEGFRASPRPAWTHEVRGLMTLGSPLDKHLFLWPALFDGPRPSSSPAERVVWRNYYDFGDPVGFELDGVREWLASTGWNAVFDFGADGKESHDHGFSRYPFPGKAHVDYWDDDAVFGHFLRGVVGAAPASKDAFKAPPRTKPSARLVSNVVPYVVVAVLLFVAGYILLKALLAAIFPDTHDAVPGNAIALRAGGLAALLLGMTAVSRIPRLTWRLTWRTAAFVAAALGVWAYVASVSATQAKMFPGEPASDAMTTWFAIGVTVLVWLLSALRPRWGLKPLLLIGTPAIVVRIAYVLMTREKIGSLWPVVGATAAFIYLWWLAALMLDLVSVWHIYIRNFRVRQQLDVLTGRRQTGWRAARARVKEFVKKSKVGRRPRTPEPAGASSSGA